MTCVVLSDSQWSPLHSMKWLFLNSALVCKKSAYYCSCKRYLDPSYTGQLKVAHDLFANSLHMFVQVYGPMHADIANCYRSVINNIHHQQYCIYITHSNIILWCLSLPPPRHMARIEYMLSEPLSALNNQHKATLILERVVGVDHPDTVAAYINLALFAHASNQSASALRLLYRQVGIDCDVMVM